MGHQISRHLDCPIFKHFEIWYPILICLYLGSRISYRKVFVLQTKLWIPPFQWIMSQLSSMFVAREIKQKLRHIFIESLCMHFLLAGPCHFYTLLTFFYFFVFLGGRGWAHWALENREVILKREKLKNWLNII